MVDDSVLEAAFDSAQDSEFLDRRSKRSKIFKYRQKSIAEAAAHSFCRLCAAEVQEKSAGFNVKYARIAAPSNRAEAFEVEAILHEWEKIYCVFGDQQDIFNAAGGILCPKHASAADPSAGGAANTPLSKTLEEHLSLTAASRAKVRYGPANGEVWTTSVQALFDRNVEEGRHARQTLRRQTFAARRDHDGVVHSKAAVTKRKSGQHSKRIKQDQAVKDAEEAAAEGGAAADAGGDGDGDVEDLECSRLASQRARHVNTAEQHRKLRHARMAHLSEIRFESERTCAFLSWLDTLSASEQKIGHAALLAKFNEAVPMKQFADVVPSAEDRVNARAAARDAARLALTLTPEPVAESSREAVASTSDCSNGSKDRDSACSGSNASDVVSDDDASYFSDDSALERAAAVPLPPCYWREPGWYPYSPEEDEDLQLAASIPLDPPVKPRVSEYLVSNAALQTFQTENSDRENSSSLSRVAGEYIADASVPNLLSTMRSDMGDFESASADSPGAIPGTLLQPPDVIRPSSLDSDAIDAKEHCVQSLVEPASNFIAVEDVADEADAAALPMDTAQSGGMDSQAACDSADPTGAAPPPASDVAPNPAHGRGRSASEDKRALQAALALMRI